MAPDLSHATEVEVDVDVGSARCDEVKARAVGEDGGAFVFACPRADRRNGG